MTRGDAAQPEAAEKWKAAGPTRGTPDAVTATVIEVAASDPPGYLTEWLPTAGLGLDVLRPYAGESLPATVPGAALIVLGGEMSAYDDVRAPWLPATRLLAAVCGGRRGADAGDLPRRPAPRGGLRRPGAGR